MDDLTLIVRNTRITLAPTPWRLWTDFDQIDYWPLTYTTFWGLWRLFENNPVPFHLVNVALHALNAFLIVVIARDFKAPWPILAGLLFLLHPLQVEAVAWVIQLKTVLATAFFFGSFLLFQRSASDRSRNHLLAGSFLLFLLGLLAKSSIVMLPACLLVAVLWRKPSVKIRTVIPAIGGFSALSLVATLVTLAVNHATSTKTGISIWNDGMAVRAVAASKHLLFYLGKFLWPSELSHLYPRVIPATNLPSSYLYPAVVAVIAFGLFWFRKRTWGRAALFCGAFYFFNILPCLGFVNIPYMRLSLIANHWTYLANAGLCVLAAAALGSLWKIATRKRYSRAVVATTTAAAIVLSSASWTYSRIYANEEVLWTDVASRYPTSAVAHYNLGAIHYRHHELNRAESEYKSALEFDPNHGRARFNLAMIRLSRGDREAAETDFWKVMQIDPSLGAVYPSLAELLYSRGEIDRALDVLEKGMHQAPRNIDIFNQYCDIGFSVGHLEEARNSCLQALSLSPGNPVTLRLLRRFQ